MSEQKAKAAYFCAEYGIDGLPFNGGLGILAGDFMKSCADLGLPVVGVGLYYKNGNFRQKLLPDGWQQEYYRPYFPTGTMKIHELNLEIKTNSNSIPINAVETIVRSSVPGSDNSIPLIFLRDHDICDVLYPGGDQQLKRLKQEYLLGYGGVKVLEKLGYNPEVYHSNEGHAALMSLALQEKFNGQHKNKMVFTTHTPVEAGIDIFSKSDAEEVIPKQHLSEVYKHSGGDYLHMMKLAMANSKSSFAVSRLHRDVSKQQFCDFPNMQNLTYVDNGVHLPTWASPEVRELYDSITNREWRLNPKCLEQAIEKVPEEIIWQVHEPSRKLLGIFLNEDPHVRKNMDYDTGKLTIGFARRFATYKQATLAFEQLERLKKLKNNVQFVFAGKSHPADDGGKELIKEVFKYMCDSKDIPIFFIEDYNMEVARAMTRGVDLWLNNPQRLREAAGTSGMKAACNFVPQDSILDGWWVNQSPPKGYEFEKGCVEGVTGWSIGRAPTDLDFLLLKNTQEAIAARERDRKNDSEDLINKLENLIVPLWKCKNNQGVPIEYAKVGKHAASHNACWFNTHRMANQYFEIYEIPIN